MQEQEIMMRRCLELAEHGRGRVSPNPMVGAVIVHQGRIIGEGFHTFCGEAHAEVNAIRSVRNPELLKESTIYVSLEPCSHYGKTPPCSELIIRMGIPRVVIGCEDPYPKVAGRGIRMLREAGIEVTVGILEQECRQQIKEFITCVEKQRPYIILKWAESADGYIDRPRTTEKPFIAAQISDESGRRSVHKLRSEIDAIMVGTNTALLDNPSLNVRYWDGRSPLRVTIDRDGRIPLERNLLTGSQPTLLFGFQKREGLSSACEFITLPSSEPLLPFILTQLLQRGIQTLMVEGGSQLLQSFIDQQLFDEVRIEQGDERFGAGVKAPKIEACTLTGK